MAPHVQVLRPSDAAVLDRVAPATFDGPIQPAWAHAFLADPRHRLAVAVEDGWVVGFASGVQYFHPDKPPELFIIEVGVSPAHQGRGIGTAVVEALLEEGRHLGCAQGWVLTSDDNGAALALYRKAGGRAAPDPARLFEFFL